jgi:drug/metabolite transporter (DMT)-like permease
MESWIYYSFLALLFTSITILSLNYLGRILNGYEEIRMFIYCTFVIAGLLSFVLLLADKQKTIINANNIIQNKTNNYFILCVLLGLGILLVINFNIQALAHTNSTKVGFPLLIINMNIILVLLMSLILYRQTINLKAGIGVILSIIGLSMVIYFK